MVRKESYQKKTTKSEEIMVIVPLCISERDNYRDTEITKLYNYISFSILLFLFLIVVFSLAYYFGLLFDLNSSYTLFFTYMDKLNLSMTFLSDIIDKFGLKEIVTLSFGFLLAYAYLFQFIKKKGVSIYTSNENESKYYLSLGSLWSAFEFIGILLLSVYLLTSKFYIQFIFVLIFFLLNIFVMSKIPGVCSKIIFNYRSLEEINPKGIINRYVNRVNRNLDEFINPSPKDELTEFDIGFTKSKEFFNLSVRLMLMSFVRKYVANLLNIIFAFTILLAFVGLIYNFNLITLIYLELLLMIWSSNLSIVQNIPTNKADIVLDIKRVTQITETHKNTRIIPYKFSNVYIIEDFSDEYIGILWENDVTHNYDYMKIMKNMIVSITYESTPIVNQTEIDNILNYNSFINGVYDLLSSLLKLAKSEPELAIIVLNVVIKNVIKRLPTIEMIKNSVKIVYEQIKSIVIINLLVKSTLLIINIIITVLCVIWYSIRSLAKKS